MRKGQIHKALRKYFTERRVGIEVAEEAKAEEERLEGVLGMVRQIGDGSPGEGNQIRCRRKARGARYMQGELACPRGRM